MLNTPLFVLDTLLFVLDTLLFVLDTPLKAKRKERVAAAAAARAARKDPSEVPTPFLTSEVAL